MEKGEDNDDKSVKSNNSGGSSGSGSDASHDKDNLVQTIVTNPGIHDVILGRGGSTSNSQGNINFRRLVYKYKLDYFASSKNEKPMVTEYVIKNWKNQYPPGRFLERIPVEKVANEGTGSNITSNVTGKNDKQLIYREVGMHQARLKTSQCLRERAPELIPLAREIQIQREQTIAMEDAVKALEAARTAQSQISPTKDIMMSRGMVHPHFLPGHAHNAMMPLTAFPARGHSSHILTPPLPIFYHANMIDESNSLQHPYGPLLPTPTSTQTCMEGAKYHDMMGVQEGRTLQNAFRTMNRSILSEKKLDTLKTNGTNGNEKRPNERKEMRISHTLSPNTMDSNSTVKNPKDHTTGQMSTRDVQNPPEQKTSGKVSSMNIGTDEVGCRVNKKHKRDLGVCDDNEDDDLDGDKGDKKQDNMCIICEDDNDDEGEDFDGDDRDKIQDKMDIICEDGNCDENDDADDDDGDRNQYETDGDETGDDVIETVGNVPLSMLAPTTPDTSVSSSMSLDAKKHLVGPYPRKVSFNPGSGKGSNDTTSASDSLSSSSSSSELSTYSSLSSSSSNDDEREDDEDGDVKGDGRNERKNRHDMEPIHLAEALKKPVPGLPLYGNESVIEATRMMESTEEHLECLASPSKNAEATFKEIKPTGSVRPGMEITSREENKMKGEGTDAEMFGCSKVDSITDVDLEGPIVVQLASPSLDNISQSVRVTKANEVPEKTTSMHPPFNENLISVSSTHGKDTNKGFTICPTDHSEPTPRTTCAHKSTEKKESLEDMKAIEECNRILEDYMAREKIDDDIFVDEDWMETTLGHPDEPPLKTNEQKKFSVDDMSCKLSLNDVLGPEAIVINVSMDGDSKTQKGSIRGSMSPSNSSVQLEVLSQCRSVDSMSLDSLAASEMEHVEKIVVEVNRKKVGIDTKQQERKGQQKAQQKHHSQQQQHQCELRNFDNVWVEDEGGMDTNDIADIASDGQSVMSELTITHDEATFSV